MPNEKQTISNLRKLKSFHNGSYAADIDRAIKALEQEPKTGNWINKSTQSACGVVFHRIECSECGELSGLSHTLAKYCPNCGCRMSEVSE